MLEDFFKFSPKFEKITMKTLPGSGGLLQFFKHGSRIFAEKWHPDKMVRSVQPSMEVPEDIF